MLIGLASTGSALAIFSSLIVVGILFNDINSLYSEIMQEMGEFKVSQFKYKKFKNLFQKISNDAWHEMMLFNGQQPSGFKASENPQFEFSSMLLRQKRGYSSGGYAKPQQCSESRKFVMI